MLPTWYVPLNIRLGRMVHIICVTYDDAVIENDKSSIWKDATIGIRLVGLGVIFMKDKSYYSADFISDFIH